MAFKKGNTINIGRKWSESTRKKQNKIRKKLGFGKWNIGKKRTKAVKKKMSKDRKGHKGCKHSIKTKKFMSEIMKAKWKDPNERTKLLKSLEKTHRKRGYTSIEIKIYSELEKLGLIFEKQKLINKRFLVDAFIPSLNLIIEADGDYWHSLEWSKKNDIRKNAYLKKCGFNLLRIPEHKIRLKDFNLEQICK